MKRGVVRNVRLNPRTVQGDRIPTTLNASALRDREGRVIGAIGILRNMREYEQVVEALRQSQEALMEKVQDLELFHDVAVDRELKLMQLEKELHDVKAKLHAARQPPVP